MKKLATATGLTGLMIAGAMLVPTGAQAVSVNGAARAYCNVERQDRQDFIRQYGSAGRVGMQRCIRREKRLANRECRAELRNDRRDFIRQFGGTNRRAFQRCMRYELRN
jgi:hypothetical protein